MNVAEPSIFSTILSFLLNLLFYLLVTILGFFGITIGESSGSGAAVPAIEAPATVTAGEIAQASSDLVNATWLATQMADSDLRIIALVSPEEFAAGHIPGAAQIDWPVFAITETSDASISAWEGNISATLGTLGITRDSHVVVYDNGSHYAPRLWWVLKALGHQNVAVLDGGLMAWQQAGQVVESGNSSASPTLSSFEASFDSSIVATKADVEAALDLPGTILIDARTPQEYAAGHIPGAVNIPFTENYAADGTLLDIDALSTLYTDLGVTPDMSIIVYCSTGVRATSDAFALNYLGYPEVRLYLGSFDEWSADPSLPIEK